MPLDERGRGKPREKEGEGEPGRGRTGVGESRKGKMGEDSVSSKLKSWICH